MQLFAFNIPFSCLMLTVRVFLGRSDYHSSICLVSLVPNQEYSITSTLRYIFQCRAQTWFKYNKNKWSTLMNKFGRKWHVLPLLLEMQGAPFIKLIYRYYRFTFNPKCWSPPWNMNLPNKSMRRMHISIRHYRLLTESSKIIKRLKYWRRIIISF